MLDIARRGGRKSNLDVLAKTPVRSHTWQFMSLSWLSSPTGKAIIRARVQRYPFHFAAWEGGRERKEGGTVGADALMRSRSLASCY